MHTFCSRFDVMSNGSLLSPLLYQSPREIALSSTTMSMSLHASVGNDCNSRQFYSTNTYLNNSVEVVEMSRDSSCMLFVPQQ